MCTNCNNNKKKSGITPEWREWYLYGQYEDRRKARQAKAENSEAQQPEALTVTAETSTSEAENPKAQYWAVLDSMGIKYKKTQSVQTLIELINANS